MKKRGVTSEVERQNIKVSVRLRPLMAREMHAAQVVDVIDDSTLRIAKGAYAQHFAFDRVFPQHAGQADVYELARASIDAFLQGFNSTIMAYGQTGTGKTYTMLGAEGSGTRPNSIPPSEIVDRTADQTAGIIPRAIEQIWQHMRAHEAEPNGSTWSLSCSYMELYNEHLRDLLLPSAFPASTLPPSAAPTPAVSPSPVPQSGGGMVAGTPGDETPPTLQLGGGGGGVGLTVYTPPWGRGSGAGPSMEIREDKTRGLFVEDLTEVICNSVDEVMAQLSAGLRNRAVRSTEMNEHSSRSHTIFQVHLEQRLHLPVDSLTTPGGGSHTDEPPENSNLISNAAAGDGATSDLGEGGEGSGVWQPQSESSESSERAEAPAVVRRCKLNLVDLAGSEKWRTATMGAQRIQELTADQHPTHLMIQTHTTHDGALLVVAGGSGRLEEVDLAGSEKWRTATMGAQRIQELTAINQSLSALGNCIAALTQPGRSHIPFRDSKLTRLLQDSLGGNTKTTFVVTLSPSIMSFDESLSALKFADRAKRVIVHAHLNEEIDQAALIARLDRECRRLRGQLAEMSQLQFQLPSGGGVSTTGTPASPRPSTPPRSGAAGGPLVSPQAVRAQEEHWERA
ncbi:putative Kinesin protein [Paratrimastix pyriformis]|uniref:Kinesin protein n=1 Tax=Paratrimastix pyriformis TaxID=342808 RepID=A0ABQ8U5M9_9EUKA|nr:putative Kinesin protein [Paratrimastix pyriformis]